MGQFKNNQFSSDTNAEHTIRCEFFVSGAATHAAELGFRGTLVADITSHLDTWMALELQHEDEKGDVLSATALINSLQGELEALIVAGRYLVNSMLMEDDVVGIAEHDIRKDFGVEGKVPDDVASVIDLGRQMAGINEKYIDDGSPYALPEEPFENIGIKTEELDASLDARKLEHSEQMHVGKLKEIERAKGDRLLSRAFNWTVAVWGTGDTRLTELGFVPSSEIWSPCATEPPEPGEENDFPNAPLNLTGMMMGANYILSWDAVGGAESYNVYRTVIDPGDPDPAEVPAEPFALEIESLSFMDTNLEMGKTHWYWACAVMGGEVGEMSEALILETA